MRRVRPQPNASRRAALPAPAGSLPSSWGSPTAFQKLKYLCAVAAVPRAGCPAMLSTVALGPTRAVAGSPTPLATSQLPCQQPPDGLFACVLGRRRRLPRAQVLDCVQPEPVWHHPAVVGGSRRLPAALCAVRRRCSRLYCRWSRCRNLRPPCPSPLPLVLCPPQGPAAQPAAVWACAAHAATRGEGLCSATAAWRCLHAGLRTGQAGCAFCAHPLACYACCRSALAANA